MIVEPANPNPSPEEQKSNADEYLLEAIENLRQVLSERPDGMIPYERMALQALKRVEAEGLAWRRSYDLLADLDPDFASGHDPRAGA